MVGFAQFLLFLFVGSISYAVFRLVVLPAWRAMVLRAQEKDKQDAILEKLRISDETESAMHRKGADDELKDFLDGRS